MRLILRRARRVSNGRALHSHQVKNWTVFRRDLFPIRRNEAAGNGEQATAWRVALFVAPPSDRPAQVSTRKWLNSRARLNPTRVHFAPTITKSLAELRSALNAARGFGAAF